jgi:sugar phosphate isomerase/epimerase
MIDRRKFLSATGIGLAGLTGLARRARAGGGGASRSLSRIGVQLYSARSLMADDFEGTLRAIAEIGYDQVEFAGYFDHSPAEVRGILEEAGLEAPACHVSLDALRHDLTSTIETARAVGHRFVLCAWLAPEERESAAKYRALAGLFNEVGATCQEAGLSFGYHNHDFEFETVDGATPMDLLLGGTDPAKVAFEMDLYWIVKGGREPLEYFARYPGRFKLCHVKDMTTDGTMADVGAGAIDFAEIFAHSREAGLEYFFVEHDEPADPLASLAASYHYLQALRY